MIEPLRISFEIACSPDHAFSTWTRRATSWWPPEHTVSHEPGAEIVFEPRTGGRIFERTRQGREIAWGEIVEWDPPRRLRYQWHIATDPAHATDVEIVFRELPDSTTRVEIEHGGWDRLGEIGQPWRDANQAGWDGVLPSYTSCALAAGG
ncbi:MAG TPA: SRPBCC domain-containing protein [Candidatus Dormibacteraeota bacterium]|nr:SRPBCC domain-containing protein [Candidatus Dormibacteraeota bacterium]